MELVETYQKMGLDLHDTTCEDREFDWLKCDECGAQIIETEYGYVCSRCGLEPEENILHLRYDLPYNDDRVQYAPLRNTQIGTSKERLCNPHFKRLENLNKLHNIRKHNEIVLEKAKIEISRIFNYLNFAESIKNIVYERFKKIRAMLRPRTKYRSPEKLVPICIYYTFKFQNISLNQSALLEVSKISKKEFNTFKLQINNFLPEYKHRKRKEYILQKVTEVRENFNLDMEFYYLSKKILYKLWNFIRNTKDDVVAGLVSTISILCSSRDDVSVNSICNLLGIKMSTIQSQVKKNIFDQFKLTGFRTLKKSAINLKKVMEKLGVIEPVIIELDLGNAVQTFNYYDTIDYYVYIINSVFCNPFIVSLRISDVLYIFSIGNFSIGKTDYKLSDQEIFKLYNGKGPPFKFHI